MAEREKRFTRTESVVRWSRDVRAAYEAEREALLFAFYFLAGARCSNQAENYCMMGDGGEGFFPRFFVHVHTKSYFVSCACVYSEHGTAGEPGAVSGVC